MAEVVALSAGAIAGIVIGVLAVVALVLFFGLYYGLPRVASSSSASSSTSSASSHSLVSGTFPTTFVSPMISGGGSSTQTVSYSYDPITLSTILVMPGFTITTNSNVVFGLIAPGTSSFLSILQPQGGNASVTTTMDYVGGAGQVAAQLSVGNDGTFILAPTTPTLTATSIVVPQTTLSYTAVTSPVALTYGTVTNYIFNATAPTTPTTTLYYSTDQSNSFVTLTVPSIEFSTPPTWNVMNSQTPLSASAPNLRPTSTVSDPTTGQSYNGASTVNATVAITTGGAMSYTNTTGNFTSSVNSFGYLSITYAV